MNEQVNVVLPDWPQQFTNEIKRKALIHSLEKGETFLVTKV